MSFFSGKGKKTAFQARKCYSEATNFCPLSSLHVMQSDEQFSALERFVVIMYNRKTPHQDVNKVLQSMFSQGAGSIKNIPPTRAALKQHEEGSISSSSCLGAHARPQREVTKCCRVGMAWPYLRWVETDLDYPTLIVKSVKRAYPMWLPIYALRGLFKSTKANLPWSTLCACNDNCHQYWQTFQVTFCRLITQNVLWMNLIKIILRKSYREKNSLNDSFDCLT